MLLPLAIAFLLFVLPARAEGAPPSRCEGDALADVLRRVDEYGDIVTGSGKRLKLADIRLEDGARERLVGLEGDAIQLGFAGKADRWGRVPARILLSRDGTDLASLLLREGLALVDVGAADALCRRGLFAEEAEARAAWRGVWGTAFLPADDPEAIAARVGQFSVIEGRLVGVGERSRWTYLNFGRDFARDFAVSISKRNWEVMKRGWISVDSLKGRRIRVRGIIEMRRAPGIEITSLDMIEVQEAPKGRMSR